MKRFCSLLLILAFVLVFSVPAFATETPYIPELPPFLMVSGNQVKFNVDVNKATSPAVTAFFKDFDQSPHLVLLEQWSKNGIYHGENKGDDRIWWVRYVKFPATTATSYFLGTFNYDGGHVGTDRYYPPMFFAPNSDGYESVSYFYNYTENRLEGATTVVKSSHQQTFSYVIGSSATSHSVSSYPGFDTIAGKYYFTTHSEVEGTDRHYNWWIGRGGIIIEPSENPDTEIDIDTDGDGVPDVNVDTDGDGKPDINIDTDGDKKPDINIDTNGDKKPDLNIDTNGDRKPDLNIDTNGDGKPDLNIDTNGDGKPDLNIDTNGDGKPDLNIDTNGDGKPDLNIDTNGDGKPDLNIDTNGDKKPDVNIDTNGDGKPDINIDSDGDGWPDTNLKPGGSGDGSGGGGGGASSSVEIPPKEDNGSYKGWNLFNPFDYDYTPPDSDYNYDPMEGYETPDDLKIPIDFDIPDNNEYHNPFWVPEWAKNKR